MQQSSENRSVLKCQKIASKVKIPRKKTIPTKQTLIYVPYYLL